MKKYELTKEKLISLGITDVKEDGTIYNKNGVKSTYIVTGKHKYGQDREYPVILLTDYFKPKRKDCRGWLSHPQTNVLVSNVVWVWFNGQIPQGYDIDHIDNNPLNNKLSNLQLLTRKENLAKRGCGRNQYNYYMTDEEILAKRKEKQELVAKKRELRKTIRESKNKIKEIRTTIKESYVEWRELVESED